MRPSLSIPLVTALASIASCGVLRAEDAGRPVPVRFREDIEPLLAARCHRCHGPKKQESGLRLDRRQTALRGGDRGPALVPGKAAESLLIRAIRGLDDELPAMPPRGEKLAPAEVARIERWIDEGASWPDDATASDPVRGEHWAFVPPVRPPLPEVEGGEWPRNPIDRFVLARLEREGLAPSPEADRATLIRRLSLDLIGLPPELDEVDPFLADARAEAYEDEVERLLASPHFGERWGRHWLDAARYADSDGYEKDKSREVWFYRDWVVGALSRDLPYDRFIIEQIAGDLLPGAGQDELVATGFLRNSMVNEEGGVDPEQFRMEAMFDRMDAIGKSILGLTIQCAQCHDHKYDPLAQKEYYRLFAHINNAHEASITVYTAEETAKRDGVLGRIAKVEAELRRRTPDWRERMAAWEERVRGDVPRWEVVRPRVTEISTGGQKYLPLDDGSFLAQGYAPTKHRVEMVVETELDGITGFRLEILTDPNLPRGGPGRSIFGTCALTEFEVTAAPLSAPRRARKVEIARATADFEPSETPLQSIFDDRSKRRRVTGPVAFAIDGEDTTAWGSDAGHGRRNQPRKAVFAAKEPISHTGGTVLHFYLQQNHGGWNSDDNQNHNLGRFRLSVTSSPDPVADPLPSRVREALALPRDARSPAQEAAVFSYWRTTVPEWREANERIEALWREHPEGASQLVLKERETPRATHILTRGDFLRPSEPVAPGTPAFLHPRRDEGLPPRLELARWLVDRRSPTTARSIVNRLWQTYFGTGLVSTSEDLGTRSEPPSHPELLDWLAVELMDGGWSLKRIHRLIVTSATYRQTSHAPAERYLQDPENRLLARGPRFRVEAEVARDIALAASGLLERRMGGPSVFPPLPAFMLQPPVSYGPKVWDEEKGPDRYRRALYTFRYRSLPYPVLQAFDAPNGDFACVRRARSNTPIQALVTLNEPLFVECARGLAWRALESGAASDDAERLEIAFRRCLARRPRGEEAAELVALIETARSRYAGEESLAHEVLAARDASGLELPDGATVAELAAWTVVARVLLNLDETITKE